VEDPVRVVVTNYPDDEVEWFDVPSFPHDVPGEGSRMVPFSGELYVDRDDVREDPPDGFYRLYPGNEVRLRWAWVVECQEIVRDADGDIEEVRVTYDPETRGGETPDGREIQGTIHWVDSQRALPCELRLYDRLFEVEDPRGAEGDFTDHINDDSLVIKQGYIEPSVRLDAPGTRYQFERNGYFMSERQESGPDQLVYNRIVTLRDTWESRRAEERKREAERRAEERRREKERKRQEARAARQKRIDALTEVARGAEVEGYEPTPRDQTRMEDGTLRDRLDVYLQELDLTPDEGDLLSGSPALSDYFEQMRQDIEADAAAKWLVNTLVPLIGAEVGTDAFEKAFEDEAPPVEHATALVQILEADRVTHNVGEEVLDEMLETGDGPEAIIEREGLEAITDTAQLGSIIEEVMADNPDQVDAYGQGKRKLLGYFIGQVMQATQGKAEPQTVRELLQQELPDPSQDADG
jgi:glutaminyl-tRNA synthetase